MSKRRQKTESAIIHATTTITKDVEAALDEQLYGMIGPVRFARVLAARLRDSFPEIARMLDPQGDDYFQLVVVRRRGGKSPTRHVNDAAIAKVIVKQEQRAGRPKHGEHKFADGEVAKYFEISDHKVRKVRRGLRSSK